MAKTINVTEYGSNRKLTIVVSNILHTEPLQFSNGVLVTLITLVGEKQITTIENVVQVNAMINSKD